MCIIVLGAFPLLSGSSLHLFSPYSQSPRLTCLDHVTPVLPGFRLGQATGRLGRRDWKERGSEIRMCFPWLPLSKVTSPWLNSALLSRHLTLQDSCLETSLFIISSDQGPRSLLHLLSFANAQSFISSLAVNKPFSLSPISNELPVCCRNS